MILKFTDDPSLRESRKRNRAAAQMTADYLESIGVQGQMTALRAESFLRLRRADVQVQTLAGPYTVSAEVYGKSVFPSLDLPLMISVARERSSVKDPGAPAFLCAFATAIAPSVWAELGIRGTSLRWMSIDDGPMMVLTDGPSGQVLTHLTPGGGVRKMFQMSNGHSMSGGAFGAYLHESYTKDLGDLGVLSTFLDLLAARAQELSGLDAGATTMGDLHQG